MPRPSGSVMTSAKLVVPAGTLVQDSGGETLSPTQFGLDLLEPAFFFASIWPSLNEDEVMVKTACAFALWPLSVSATPAAITNAPKLRSANMTFPLDTWLVELGLYLDPTWAGRFSWCRECIGAGEAGATPLTFSLRSVRSLSSPRPSATARCRGEADETLDQT